MIEKNTSCYCWSTSPDARIIFTKALFIQYEQILLDKNFGQYLETLMVSKKILHMGAQKTPIEKTYEINIGQDSKALTFWAQVVNLTG